MAVLAAIVYAVATAGVVAFQIALAAGAPWGAYAMGGALPGSFPTPMRVAALVQGILLAFLAVVALSRAGAVWPSLAAAVPWLIWTWSRSRRSA